MLSPSRARFAGTVAGVVFSLEAAGVCSAAPPSTSIGVTRAAGAESCPDAAAIAGAVASAMPDRDVAAVAADWSGTIGLRVDVAFAREPGGYQAMIVSSGALAGERTISNRSDTCTALAQAVVASVVVVVDNAREVGATSAPDTASGAATAAPSTPAAQPAPHAIDAADVPPFNRPARSEEGPEPFASSRGRPRWYGWEIAIGDGASVLGMAVGLSAGGWAGDALGEVSLAGYLAAGPVIHAVHGRLGATLGSVGLRVGLPLVGSLVGAVIANAVQPPCPPQRNDPGLAGAIGDSIGASICPAVRISGGVVIGGLTGALAASAADVGLLGWTKAEAHRRSEARVQPVLGLTSTEGRRRLTLGIGGVF